jgi:hypothetical protein
MSRPSQITVRLQIKDEGVRGCWLGGDVVLSDERFLERSMPDTGSEKSARS